MHKPPRPQRQRLQLQRRRPYIRPKRHHTDDHADDVGDVIPIPLDHAFPTAVEASVFLCLESAGESRGDEVTLEGFQIRRRGRGRMAGGDGELVDELEDEEAGEGAAEVGDTVCMSRESVIDQPISRRKKKASSRRSPQAEERKRERRGRVRRGTYVASNVI